MKSRSKGTEVRHSGVRRGEVAGGLEALLRGCISPGEQRGHTDLDLNSSSAARSQTCVAEHSTDSLS